MNYFDRVGRSLEYIESHLGSEIDLKHVADAAYCSLFYFHRIFQAMVGDTIKEYIRKRRLTEAARLLTQSDRRILDIALDLGYGSQEAFTRAFKAAYGRTPRGFRVQGWFYALRESRQAGQLEFDHLVRSGTMEPEIIRKPAFSVIGKQIVTKNDGTNFREIPLFWQDYGRHGTGDQVPNKKSPWTCYGICADMNDGDGSFIYMIGEEVTSVDHVPEGMVCRSIPEATYAVFTARGPIPETIQKVTTYAYGTWLPGNGVWERTETEDFELYDERCNGNPPEVDICVPVRKKQV